MNNLIHELVSLGGSLLIAYLVWRYYRTRTFATGVKYLTFGPRFWTGSVDACVIWPIGFAATVIAALNISGVLAAVLVIVQNLAWSLYTIFMHAKYGQTYGKMVCKVKVVDFATEGALSIRQALLREGIPMVASLGGIGYEVHLLATGRVSYDAITSGEITRNGAFWLIESIPLLWFSAEVITMFTNDKRRALHDYIAGTVVIRTNLQSQA